MHCYFRVVCVALVLPAFSQFVCVRVFGALWCAVGVFCLLGSPEKLSSRRGISSHASSSFRNQQDFSVQIRPKAEDKVALETCASWPRKCSTAFSSKPADLATKEEERQA